MKFALQLLLLTATAAVLTAAMTCKNMITSSNGNTGATNDILETGQYRVRTTMRTDSAEVKDLISKLNGASDIQHKRHSFTAILRPKDLKKVINKSIDCFVKHSKLCNYKECS